MKLPDIITKIKRLASLDMPVEALKALFLDLAVELDLEEARLSKDRERKPHGISKEPPRNIHGNGVEFPASRVIDNLPSCLTSGEESKEKGNLTVSQKGPSSKPLEPAGFAEFFDAYPKRAGDADRKPAAKAYGAALKRTDSKTLLWAAGRYSADCKAKGTINTEYVKKARTWLNDDGWKEYQNQDFVENLSLATMKTKIPVLVGTPAWQAWKDARPNLVGRDIRCEDGRVRQGWYFPTEFPPGPESQAA